MVRLPAGVLGPPGGALPHITSGGVLELARAHMCMLLRVRNQALVHIDGLDDTRKAPCPIHEFALSGPIVTLGLGGFAHHTFLTRIDRWLDCCTQDVESELAVDK